MNPRVMPGHRRDVLALAFGKERLLSASRDRTAIVSTLDGARVATLEGALDTVTAIAELDDGRVVTASVDCGVRVYGGAGFAEMELAKGHTSAIHALVTDGARIATASEDGSVRLWTRSGAGPVLRGHEEGARTAEFTGKNEITTTSGTGLLRTWNTTTGKLLSETKAKRKAAKKTRGPTLEVAKGVTAEARDDGTVRLKKGKKEALLAGHDDAVTALAAQDDFLAVGAANGAIQLWDWRKALAHAPPQPQPTPALERVWSVEPPTKGCDTRFEGTKLWVGRNSELFEYEVANGKRGKSIAVPGDVCAFDERHVVFAEYDKTVRVFDREQGKVSLEVPLENNYLYPRGGPLAWTTKRTAKPNSIRLLDPATSTLASFGEIEGVLDRPIFSADRSLVVAGSEERPEAYVFDVASTKLLATLHWEGARAAFAYELAFTHDNTRLVVGSRDGRAYVFDVKTGALLHELRPPKEPEPRFGWTPLCVSPAADRAVVWGNTNKHPILFDLANGAPLARLFAGEPDSGYSTRAFSPDGTRLVTAHRARAKLAFHDPVTGARLVQHDVHRAEGSEVKLTFLRDRVITHVPSEEDRSIRCWDTKTGERVWANLGLGGTQINAFVVSPTARFLAVTARNSELVRLVDLATGKTLAELPGHIDYAREPSFSEDETRLATSSNEGGVQVWKL